MRNRLLTLALLCGALALTAEPVRQLRLTREPTLTLGGEFPGALGRLDAREDAATIAYDLDKGAYVGLVTPAVLHQGTTSLTFRVRPTSARVAVRGALGRPERGAHPLAADAGRHRRRGRPAAPGRGGDFRPDGHDHGAREPHALAHAQPAP